MYIFKINIHKSSSVTLDGYSVCFNIGSFIGNLSPNSGDKKYSLIAGDKNFIFSGELYFFLELNVLCKCLCTSCLYLFEIKMKIMS